MRKWLLFLLPVVLICVTAVSIMISERERTSGELTQITTEEDGGRIRKDYVDENGQVTMASDRRYATLIQTYDGKQLVLEEYLDADGRPATLSSGYSAIRREYNQDGKNTVITYLGPNGKPVRIPSGYSSIHRSYNTEGRADTDTYYAGEEQVPCTSGYWGYRREYDEAGRISRILFLDREGNLTLCRDGYAVTCREYNDEGRLEREFYLNTEETPTASSQGEYGFYREYDGQGRAVRTVYLDAEGAPANTNKGYAEIRREYGEDGITTKTLYFDAQGNPATAGQYQYGVESADGLTVFLDEDGERMLRLDNFLNNFPWVVLVCGVLLTLLASFLQGWKRAAFLAAYLGFIIVMTLWYRETGDSHGRFEPFYSYRHFLTSSGTRQQILNNIWLFMPLGAALWKKGSKHWLIPVFVSAGIETVQYVTGLGLCEVDDVISNSLGGLLGYGVAFFFAGLRSPESGGQKKLDQI